MGLIRCPNGHMFSERRYGSICPYCNIDTSKKEIPAMFRYLSGKSFPHRRGNDVRFPSADTGILPGPHPAWSAAAPGRDAAEIQGTAATTAVPQVKHEKAKAKNKFEIFLDFI